MASNKYYEYSISALHIISKMAEKDNKIAN